MPVCPSSESMVIDMEADKSVSEELYADDDLDIVEKLSATEVEKLHGLFKGIEDKSIPVSHIAESKELMKLDKWLTKYKAILANRSPTAKLWLNYIEYVETLKLFIRAERTGNWVLASSCPGKNDKSVCCNWPYYYAKSSQLYLQVMLHLPNDDHQLVLSSIY